MPQIFTGMPFTLEGRFDDPDNYPNSFLNSTWSVLSCPTGIPSPSGGAQTVFIDTVSVTPRVIVDTPGDYVVQLAVFDGLATTSVQYPFTAAASYAATAYLSGSCASTGSGLSTSVKLVYANATSVTSQNDANMKAAANAAGALSAALSCCPASIQMALPSDAPPGSIYSVSLAPSDALPKEDFSPTIPGSGSSVISVIIGTGISAGGTVELANALPFSLLNANQSASLIVEVQEPVPFSGYSSSSGLSSSSIILAEPVNCDLSLAPLASNGNLAGASAGKRQKNAAFLSPNFSRALNYAVSLPSPASSRLSLNLTNRLPPLPVMQVNGAGWDITGSWAGNNVNALGLFLLTGGTLTAPTSEALLLAMNAGNADLALMSAYYDLPGFSRIPYQGSLYGYSDRRGLAPVPRTGFVGSFPSTIYTWAQALSDYITRNALIAPYSCYFRAGNWSGTAYTWYPDSVPLHLERAGSDVTRNSLSASGALLSAANSVITLASTDPINAAFFATVRNVPAFFVDLYRWSALAPGNAVGVGVYSVTPWPAPTSVTRLLGLVPGLPAGRGYDTTNLAINPLVNGILKLGGTNVFAFYYEDSNSKALAGFPLFAQSLTNFSGAAYSLASMPGGTSLPAAVNNVLVNTASGTKVYLANNNA